MNQNFKLKFDEMKEGNPTDTSATDTKQHDFYDTAGHARNLDFVWPSGERQFFNYAYLVSCRYACEPEETIRLIFTTDTVSLKGLRLLKLYSLIREHSIKVIACVDGRYNEIFDDSDSLVNYIEVFKTS
ncbi:hypothetical protein [Mucilaginibacter psychrotolerans]|uniref:Uncharacterized protein n=1 Tax=Mucilaginibacter psychrotolerans TaxID=1524096 RepID=A0A4Y8SCL4_9SPHI|nr:hypothetical protein [Mucilaginibacter psychrotolerans]TFF36174.1 hypothetical protein E2R66_16665 [Mucilaginibacter psychrotolerans]